MSDIYHNARGENGIGKWQYHIARASANQRESGIAAGGMPRRIYKSARRRLMA